MDLQLEYLINPMKQFAKDSFRLVKRCNKPDRKGEPHIVSHFFPNYLT